MSDALFDSTTARFSLPLLFAGQAQKEMFVNEMAARLDALLFLAVEAEAAIPPPEPQDGQSWLVGENPAGQWSGQAGRIASRQAGNWLFTKPVPGMTLFNRATGQEMYFRGTWLAAAKPELPTGGATIDQEARTAIGAIIAALTTAGIITDR